jgi:hypothetical protein
MRPWWIFLLVAAGAHGPTFAQGPKPATAAAAAADMNVLKGAWVRPDGGYVIQIKSVGADGKLDARYFNHTPLPFARAQASVEATLLRVSLELRAGGYGGSTYELGYDAATDRLKGVYYQAVAKQRFDVAFARKPN